MEDSSLAKQQMILELGHLRQKVRHLG